MKTKFEREQMRRLMTKWDPLLKGIEDPKDADGKTPAWVTHGMDLIRQAKIGRFPTKLPPIISVQPMTGPVGGLAFYDLKPRWEPSAVDRLGALAAPDSELAKRIAAFDRGNE